MTQENYISRRKNKIKNSRTHEKKVEKTEFTNFFKNQEQTPKGSTLFAGKHK